MAIPQESTRIPAIPRKEIQNAAERLVEMEESLVDPKPKKRKSIPVEPQDPVVETIKPKKRKSSSVDPKGSSLVKSKSKPKKNKSKAKSVEPEPVQIHSEVSNDSIGSEDNSMYLNDSNLLDHVGDNYMSYLAEMDKDRSVVVEAEPMTPKSSSSALKKKVNFVLAKNLEHRK